MVLFSDETHAPYERPPLSKEYLAGSELQVRGIAPGRQANEQVLLNCAVVSVDAQARMVTCSDGSHMHYDSLLLATGGRARRLSVPGSEWEGVLGLRTAADADALRQAIDGCGAAGRPLLVVGGSWIGLEVAAGARAAGAEVVLLELGDRLCLRTLPAAAAQWLHALHVRRGVDIRLRTSLDHLHGAGGTRTAHLSDGSRLEVGAVVVGVGIAPNVDLAQQCGALVRGGVVVDGHGRTSVAGVYAAGDVAEQSCIWHGAATRIETWDNANRQGEAAAMHIGRGPSGQASASGEAGNAPPWFWSDQYGENLQVVGAPLQGDEVLTSEPQTDRSLTVHLREGCVVGAVGINQPREVRRLRKLLGETRQLSRQTLLELRILG